MNLLFLNWQDWTNPQAGGAEVHIRELGRRLAARGHQVALLASGHPGAPPRETLDGIEIHRTGGRYTYNLAAPLRYRSLLRGEPFDAVVEVLNKVPVYAPLWTGKPTALLVHHLFGETAFEEAPLPVAAATWVLERPIPLVYRGVRGITISESTADDLARRGLDRRLLEVIPVGVDAAFFTPGPEEERFPEPTVLYLGRLKRYKGVDLLLRAMARLREDGLAVRCLVAGKGDAEPELRGLAAELGLGEAVEFTGFVSEQRKRELFRRAWLHVLPSAKEGWGITNVEAGGCATPTVASDSPGLRESVVDGETGFLVPHGDVARLAARIRTLVEDPELRGELGRKARAFALGLSWDVCVARTEEVLAEVAAGGGAGPDSSAGAARVTRPPGGSRPGRRSAS